MRYFSHTNVFKRCSGNCGYVKWIDLMILHFFQIHLFCFFQPFFQPILMTLSKTIRTFYFIESINNSIECTRPKLAFSFIVQFFPISNVFRAILLYMPLFTSTQNHSVPTFHLTCHQHFNRTHVMDTLIYFIQNNRNKKICLRKA